MKSYFSFSYIGLLVSVLISTAQAGARSTVDCRQFPQATECQKSTAWCDKFPLSSECEGTSQYCDRFPLSSSCEGSLPYCEKFPLDESCRPSGDLCQNNPNHPSCDRHSRPHQNPGQAKQNSGKPNQNGPGDVTKPPSAPNESECPEIYASCRALRGIDKANEALSEAEAAIEQGNCILSGRTDCY